MDGGVRKTTPLHPFGELSPHHNSSSSGDDGVVYLSSQLQTVSSEGTSSQSWTEVLLYA